MLQAQTARAVALRPPLPLAPLTHARLSSTHHDLLEQAKRTKKVGGAARETRGARRGREAAMQRAAAAPGLSLVPPTAATLAAEALPA